MKTIEITCNSNGIMNFSCYTENNYKYVFYSEVIDDILDTVNSNIATKIVDGNIYFKNNNTEIIIKNYRNNKDITLDKVIERVKVINKIQKNKRLKKQKIKRIKTFASVTFISLSIIFANNLINLKADDKEIDMHPTSSNIEQIENIKINEEKLIEIEEDKEVTQLNIENDETQEQTELDFLSRVDTEKYIETKNNYYNKIESIANDYGIDPRIMLAIATQESGEHIIDNGGAALGLMQIELSVWDGQTISAFNFNTNEQEKITITKEKLKDLDFNIKVACMHFQKCLIDSNYDLNVAIQMYNYGYGNILETFRLYYKDNNITLNDAINNCDNDWLNYRDYIEVGDKEYLEHVVSYIENLNNITCKKSNGELINYSYKTPTNQHINYY